MTNINFSTVGWPDLSFRYSKSGRITGVEHKPMLAGPVLWYNSDESGRAKNSNEYGCRSNQYLYPAVSQGRSREWLIDYGEQITGHRFLKSACVECPFPEENYIIERAKTEWQEFARTVVREMQVFRLNPRMHQYGFGTSYWVAHDHVPQALELAQKLWSAKGPWKVFHLRRVIMEVPSPTDKNPLGWRTDSSRSIQMVSQHTTYDQAVAALRSYGELTWIDQTDTLAVKRRIAPKWVRALPESVQRERTLAGEDLRGEAYVRSSVPKVKLHKFICHPFPIVEVKARDLLKLPRCEEQFTIVPHCVVDKVANESKFETLWEEMNQGATQGCLF